MATKTTPTNDQPLRTVRFLHPEQLRVGDDVAISDVTYQFPSFFWCGADTFTLPASEPVRVTFLNGGEQKPLRIKSICLPFVLCKEFRGKSRWIDIRQTRLARLDEKFAKEVKAAIRADVARRAKRKLLKKKQSK